MHRYSWFCFSFKEQIASLCLFLLFIAGCSSSIKTYNSAGQETKGIPIYSPVLVEVETTTTYTVDPNHKEHAGDCEEPVITSKIQTLPLGEVSYINVETADFAKTEFGVTFSDQGILTGVTLNTDPEASENLEQGTALLSAVLPLLLGSQAEAPASIQGGVIADSTATDSLGAGTMSYQERRDKYCIKKAEAIKVFMQTIEEKL